jgi:hypothetical protein
VCTIQIKLPGADKIWAMPFLSILMPPETGQFHENLLINKFLFV